MSRRPTLKLPPKPRAEKTRSGTVRPTASKPKRAGVAPKPAPGAARDEGATPRPARRSDAAPPRPARSKPAAEPPRPRREDASPPRRSDDRPPRKARDEAPPRKPREEAPFRGSRDGAAPRRTRDETAPRAPRQDAPPRGARGESRPRTTRDDNDWPRSAPPRPARPARDGDDRPPRPRRERSDEGDSRAPSRGRTAKSGDTFKPTGAKPRRDFRADDQPPGRAPRGSRAPYAGDDRPPRPSRPPGPKAPARAGSRPTHEGKPARGFADRRDDTARKPRGEPWSDRPPKADRAPRADTRRKHEDAAERPRRPRADDTRSSPRPARPSFDSRAERPPRPERATRAAPAHAGKPPARRGARDDDRRDDFRPRRPAATDDRPREDADAAPVKRAASAELPRLSKRMSELGLCSRREADEWIENGWVRVDGAVAELGTRVHPNAKIEIDEAARQHQSETVTILLHKPMGYVSGQAEDGYEPAMVLVRPENRWEEDKLPTSFKRGHLRGLAPAGRLDIDSTGLLVFTQDGRIARRLVGDDSKVEKEYLVRVEGRPIDNGLALLNHGLELDGKKLKPAHVSWQNEDQLRFVLREGKKRQIRRMCELVGLTVTGLKRIRIGSVVLSKLPPGKWRYLRPDETF